VSSLVTWIADHLIKRHEQRVDVRLRVHSAILITDPQQPECYFLNVWNASPERAVSVTHVWIASDPRRASADAAAATHDRATRAVGDVRAGRQRSAG
jgi:hypothetical protein